jgi:hypothetical protein
MNRSEIETIIGDIARSSAFKINDGFYKQGERPCKLIHYFFYDEDGNVGGMYFLEYFPNDGDRLEFLSVYAIRNVKSNIICDLYGNDVINVIVAIEDQSGEAILV